MFRIGDKVQIVNCRKDKTVVNEHIFDLLGLPKEVHNLTGRVVEIKIFSGHYSVLYLLGGQEYIFMIPGSLRLRGGR